MATAYTINGTTASLAPSEQKWRGMQIGRAHDQRQLLSGNWEIDLLFDSASVTHMRQWAEAASAASANVTVLDQYKLGYTDLSAVQLEMLEYPSFQAGVSGPWSMVIRGASPNS